MPTPPPEASHIEERPRRPQRTQTHPLDCGTGHWYPSLVDSGTSQGTRVLQTRVPHKVLEFFKFEYLVPTFLTPITELMHNEWCTLTTTLTSFQLHLWDKSCTCQVHVKSQNARVKEYRSKSYCWVTICKSQCQCFSIENKPFNLWVLPAVYVEVI